MALEATASGAFAHIVVEFKAAAALRLIRATAVRDTTSFFCFFIGGLLVKKRRPKVDRQRQPDEHGRNPERTFGDAARGWGFAKLTVFASDRWLPIGMPKSEGEKPDRDRREKQLVWLEYGEVADPGAAGAKRHQHKRQHAARRGEYRANHATGGREAALVFRLCYLC